MMGIGAGPDVAASPTRSLVARAPASALFANPGARYVAGVLTLAVLYRGVAQVGYELQFAGPVAAVAWLPVGVGIAFLYLRGLQYWPGVLLGDLLANDYGALPIGSAIGQTCGNVLEVVVATMLLRKLLPDGAPLRSVGGLGRMLIAIAAGTAVSATIGTLSLLLGGVVEVEALVRVWRTWWLGDASGALIVLPLALAWAQPPRQWSLRTVELVAVLVLIAGLSDVALHYSEPLTYLVFPPLMWAALRLGPQGATLAVAVAAGFAIWETTRHVGPFAYESITHSVLATQLYLAVSALSTLCVAAVVAEREAFALSLAASRARIVEAAAAERRRIEQNLHDGAQQRLAALVVRLNLAADKARGVPAAAAGALGPAAEEASAAIDELREIAHGIHPSVLTDHGLAQSLQAVAARSAIPVRLVELPGERVDATAEITAYYVVLEAIANASKHAAASSIEVRAATTRSGLRLEIADDGRGGASEGDGAGLQGLRDRVEAIGGSFAIQSEDGRGTRVVAILPVASSPRVGLPDLGQRTR
jgi:signal transduction histidine kinase